MAYLLLYKLVVCAKAIEGGSLNVADSLLAEIQSLASKEESIWTRKVVKYFAEALVRRAYGIRPPCIFPLLSAACMYVPFYAFARITSKHAIADALNSGNKRLHIIDFSNFGDYWRWRYLIKELEQHYGGLQSVLISSISPKLSKHSCHPRFHRGWAEGGNVELWGWAEGGNVELRHLICNIPYGIVNCISELRRKREDEIVVVNWNFTLHKLLAQDGAMEQVLSKVKDLGADIMVIVEQEANLNSPCLSERLEQSFQYYSTIFESLEEDYGSNALWEMYFRRQIGNVVACEGVDRVERIESFAHWQNRLSQAGFCPVPQQVDKLEEDLSNFKEFGIEEKEGHTLLLRHGFPVAVASVWKVTDPPQFSGGYWKNMLTGLYTMQDRVDDSEGMASSSESEDDEENDSLAFIMADRNLWSTQTQGSSINRIAASAKLYDILEYICDLHELPLAVTWVSYGQDGNTNSKGKRVLCIDDSACYVNDWLMDGFVEEYAQHRLEEGKGIAGKALQSNIHIQHDISVLNPAEFPCDDCGTISRWIRKNYAAFAIRLTSTHPCKDDYVLEFLLPELMKETSERELLINKVLRTLQRKCLKLWKLGVRDINEARLNATSIEAEETRELLEQDVHEQSAIPAPALNGENASLSGLQSTNKRRKISTVWDGFVKHRGENGEEWATCRYCKKKYRAESTRGTSNFLKHLKKCSPSRQDEAGKQIVVETGDLSTSVIQRNFVINQERSRLDIAKMMIKHGYPLAMVQHEFFEIFVKNLQPVFKLYSKDEVTDDVLAICRQEKEKLINCFDKLSSLLSLTLELWSSTDKMMTCCFTVHFIDDGWQLKKKILAFRNLRYNYDMGTVHEVFKSVLTEWSINKNVRFIVLDITPPNDHMIGELRSKVSDQAPRIHGHLFCVPSYAQILSLLAQDGFSEIRSVLYKIRECIEYVNGSSLRRQRFQEAINDGSLLDREMRILDVPARWDTTFLMLENSLEFRTAFNHLEQFDCDFKVNPSAEEWNKATSICECLKEFCKSTCNPTSREHYFLNVCDVYNNLLKWEQSDYVYVRAMANRMKGKLDEYWGEASLALGISVVLNPYFKWDIIEYGYQQIYGSDADLHLSRFRYDLKCAYHKYAKDISSQGPSSSAMADVSPRTSSDISFIEWRKGKYERNMVHSQRNELDQYLQLPPPVNLDKDGNILAWWRDNARNFPILGKMARDFLAIPVSTVISNSSEVMKMASVHDGVRPEIAEALICGKDWLDSPNWNN
ncbi:PREDICTED: zinc finger BED domain-containing protein RICESLEEPER 2-like isoform X3 [Populus euphratica]|uniref:Zinc finger BED domain-containing protein RICESLEEPER 2-like isoform X3 n=1 Tax=Populus euphratica TaxID=75702 RepID=A0AAJ6Y3V8_POPEU|nr:PREDICTED: zinc finger BED domain-containing protein RICESLEEPER 2-like isoform X3 [Populus euphratica]